MATYEEIYGKRVKEFDSDPTLDSTYEGQVWYDKSTGVLKTVVPFMAFRSGGSLPSGRDYGTGGGATQTSSWVAGGEEGSTFLNTTYLYDGHNWSAAGNMGDARVRMALGNNGPQTAGIGTGGYSPGIVTGVEEFDGSTWTGGTALPGSLQQHGGAGPQTANIILGGGNPTTSLSYNGSAWSSEGSSSEAFAYYGLAGANSEAALAFYGAEGPPGTNRTTGEEYNGTSWTTVIGTLPSQGNSGGAQGTVTSAIFAGNSTTVRSYDGTAITIEPSMSQSRGNGYIGGTATSGVTSGGSAPGSTANVEEFDKSINTITNASWASGGAYPSTAVSTAGAGTQTAAIGFGGYDPGGNLATSYLYNGSTWTSAPSLSEARQAMGSAVGAPQTAALAFGGYNTPGPPYERATTNEWNGSTWSATGSLNQARDNAAGTGIGIQTSALCAGGGIEAGTNTNVENYNGSTWTALSALPAGKRQHGSMGITTAGAVFGGRNAPGAGPVSASTLEYDGSSWTTGGTMSTARMGLGGCGTLTAGLAFKGWLPAETTQCEEYNGTSWAGTTSASTASYYPGSAGNNLSSGALSIAGRSTPAYLNSVEEFNDGAETVASKTLTTS